MSNDETLHNLATRIKARATRRAGELINQIEASKGGDRGNQHVGGSKAGPPYWQLTAAAGAPADAARSAPTGGEARAAAQAEQPGRATY